MNATIYVVRGFRCGFRQKEVLFADEKEARSYAAYLSEVLDYVSLSERVESEVSTLHATRLTQETAGLLAQY